MRRAAAAIALFGLLGCTPDPRPRSSTPTSVAALPATTGIAADDIAQPVVDEIDDAVAALEEQLGSVQQYFEINATPKLVNLFVALNNGAVVQPWVYLDGELSPSEGRAADGGTFTAADLDFDPAAVLATVREQIPGAQIETFYVNGDGRGNVRYGALVTSAEGGGLEVLLAADGTVLSVDPID